MSGMLRANEMFVLFALCAKSLAYVAGGISERARGGAAIFRRFASSFNSTLHQSSHGFVFRGFVTKTKALAREIPPATQATKSHVLRVFPILVPRGRAPFGQHQESQPLASSNDIPVLNGFVNTID